MRIVLATPPAAEPVSLDTAKAFLKVDVDTDDDLIGAMIAAARGLIEEHLGRRLITQAVTGWLDRWPCTPSDDWWDGVRELPVSYVTGEGSTAIALPIGPVLASPAPVITTYADDDTATIADASTYFLATEGYGKARLQLRRSAVWPQTVLRPANGIKIAFSVGYGAAASDVPSAIVLAVLNLVAHLYERRGDLDADSLPPNVRALLKPYTNLSIA